MTNLSREEPRFNSDTSDQEHTNNHEQHQLHESSDHSSEDEQLGTSNDEDEKDEDYKVEDDEEEDDDTLE